MRCKAKQLSSFNRFVEAPYILPDYVQGCCMGFRVIFPAKSMLCTALCIIVMALNFEIDLFTNDVPTTSADYTECGEQIELI